jgi:hypothetical protein
VRPGLCVYIENSRENRCLPSPASSTHQTVRDERTSTVRSADRSARSV